MKQQEVLTPRKQIMNEGRESVRAWNNKSMAPGESALGVTARVSNYLRHLLSRAESSVAPLTQDAHKPHPGRGPPVN